MCRSSLFLLRPALLKKSRNPTMTPVALLLEEIDRRLDGPGRAARGSGRAARALAGVGPGGGGPGGLAARGGAGARGRRGAAAAAAGPRQAPEAAAHVRIGGAAVAVAAAVLQAGVA